MKNLPKKITFVLYALRKPLEAYCTSNGVKPSEVMRLALANHLGVAEPQVAMGRPGREVRTKLKRVKVRRIKR